MRPDLNLVLIDAAKKKYLFLKELSEKLDMDNEIICQRVEQYAKRTDCRFDFIVNRAVAPLAILWGWSLPLLKHDGIFYAMKGGDCREDLKPFNATFIRLELCYPPVPWTRFSQFLAGKCIIKCSFAPR